MSERETLVDAYPLAYEGLFNSREFLRLTKQWFLDHGYSWMELEHEEKVDKDSKNIIYHIIPYKKISDYINLQIRLYMLLSNVVEVEAEVSGKRVRLNQGSIRIFFDVYMVTDYENMWGQNALYFFFRTAVDKFLYRNEVSKGKDEVMNDFEGIKDEIRTYLNFDQKG